MRLLSPSPLSLASLVLTSVIAVPMATAPAAAVPSPPGGVAATQIWPWLTVTSAADLVGRSLRDPHGETVGQIARVVVDIQDGTVLFVLVGSSGALKIGGDLLSVPFSAIRVPPVSGLANVSLSAKELNAAPRLSKDETIQAGQLRRIGPVSEPVPGRFYSTWLDLFRSSPSPREDLVSDRAALDQLGGKLASGLRNEDVKTARGDEIGEIEEVVIDPQAGRVAFLLLGRGGFLGIGEDWIPVPPQALVWSDQARAYVLKPGAPSAAEMPAFHKDRMPGQVRRDQLLFLYERYGVQPYWVATSRPAPGGGKPLVGMSQAGIRKTLEEAGFTDIEFLKPVSEASGRMRSGSPVLLLTLPPDTSGMQGGTTAANSTAGTETRATPEPTSKEPKKAAESAAQPSATTRREQPEPTPGEAKLAQARNINPATAHEETAPKLPVPDLGPNASPRDYLYAARQALFEGRTGEAQSALERAEVRLLGRAVPPGQTPGPSQKPTVDAIERALDALARNDLGDANAAIGETLRDLPG